MKNNRINLDYRRKKEYIQGKARELNLADGVYNHEFKYAIQDYGIDIIAEYFADREEQYEKVGQWISKNTQDKKDRMVFWSVMAEHFQHLLGSDENKMQDMLMQLIKNRDDPELTDEINNKIDLDIATTQALEQFQYSTMKEYLIEEDKEKKKD